MRKVLVVEDHPDMRGIIVRQVERLGFSAISAERAREGVEKAVEEKPELILMDIMMPEMDGWEATRMLRANELTRDIPILATTVLFRESDLRSCVEAGCNDYLVKPFTLEELQEKIAEVVPVTGVNVYNNK